MNMGRPLSGIIVKFEETLAFGTYFLHNLVFILIFLQKSQIGWPVFIQYVSKFDLFRTLYCT